ncbi:M20 family metallopeptidase [Candidatus Bathyarchaeota archaeon]|nr:M20 family metallopeptidase [Candidatus Bathyarchaeota archaeon]
MKSFEEDTILNYIEEHRNYAIKVLDKLVRARTVNPPGNEIEAAKVVIEELDAMNLPYQIFEKEKGRTNIITQYGEGSPSVMILSHLDVVPEGEGWEYPPFEVTLKDGKLYGRGTVDDKGSMASALLVLKAFKELGVEISGSFIVAGVADEERGSTYGVRYLLEEKLIKADYILVAEAMNGNIEIAEKGSAGGRLVSKGKQAHGSMPEKGINAIIKMAKLLAKLEEFKFTYKPDPLLGGPTLNVGVIKGGVAGNVVPPSCEAQLDIRIVPGMDKDTVKKDLEDFISKLKQEDSEINIEVDIPRSVPATSIPPDSPFIKALSEVVTDVTGRKPETFGIGGISVAKFFILQNMEAPVFSLGDESLDHMANEYITIEDLVNNAKVFALLPHRLAKLKSS